jgi:hypothetical protein
MATNNSSNYRPVIHSSQVGGANGTLTDLTIGTDGQVLIGSTAADPAFASITSASGTVVLTSGANTLAVDVNAALKITTGFATWGGSGDYFDDTTLGSFTVLRPGTGYINTTPVAWTAPQTVTGLTAGNCYYIYIDSSGTIQKTSTFTDTLFTGNIVLFECLRDSTPVTNNQITVKENHSYDFQVEPSVYLHNIVGPVIQNTANGANITLNGTQKIQINGADVFSDHGLYTTIPDSGGVAETFRKMYTLASGKWATYLNTDSFTGHYNNAGTVTALSANRYAIYTLYCSKDSLNVTTPFYFAVLDTAQYTTTISANNAISNGTTARATNELYGLEVCQLGYIIYSQASNSIVQVIISKQTLKQAFSTNGTNTASLINTDTTNFNGILSPADSNVQAALDTIDNWGSGATAYSVLIGAGVNTPITAAGPALTPTFLMANGLTSNPSFTTIPLYTGTQGYSQFGGF